jgi:uncharacterized protein (TIGR00255 family)
MINSMTGFGDASGEVCGITFTVEIKTLNNRYLKASVKLFDTAVFLEDDVERLLREKFQRGTVSCTIRLSNGAAAQGADINWKALGRYVDELREFARQKGIEPSMDLAGLAQLPGVAGAVMPEDQQAVIGPAILAVVSQAIVKVNQMRAQEGQALAEDIFRNCRAMTECVEKIRVRAPLVVQEYHEKLRKRVDELLSVAKLSIDQETLAREVAIFAERADISEELARLTSHLDQFQVTCRKDVQAGRKLDFITQEMLREANTIGSKSADAAIAGAVVDIKCCIDRLKEQVQNVE